MEINTNINIDKEEQQYKEADNNKFDWVDFYTKFASVLLTYKNDRQNLIKKLENLKNLIKNELKLSFPRSESNGNLTDIDPFTIFGIFNRGLKDDNRKSIINNLNSEFSVSAKIPNNFSGVPNINAQRSYFYAYEDERQEHDINNLWKFFEIAINLAHNDNKQNRDNFCKLYNLIISQKLVKWNITMGLFWIRPYNYINLDGPNREYIYNIVSKKDIEISKLLQGTDTISAENYLKLRDEIIKELDSNNYDFKTIPELSYNAWLNYNVKKNNTPEPKNDLTIENTKSKENTQIDHLNNHSLNTILYGPPGTGKTYNTLFYALSIIENKTIDKLEKENYSDLKKRYNKFIEKDKNDKDNRECRIKSITFHQSYGYEDFIEGIKPVCAKNENEKTTNQDSESKDIKYKIEDGIFKDFCNKAKNDTENNYVFIIDEINRGNISNIFGELITLIEPNKRAENPESASVTLPYSKESFSVPNNVYIIGTMNTADRSIALLDTALRRRFDFIEMMPDPEKLNGITINDINVEEMLKKINERIEVLYDREHTIGHAYFMELNENSSINDLKNIFKNRIIPLLQEYFYEDYHKIQLVLGDNKKSDDYKFIKAAGIESESLFGDKEIGDLPENKYEINENAFNNPTSYIQIYNIKDENQQQNS